MVIEHIAIENLGQIRFFEADLTRKINWIDDPRTNEIAAAIRFIQCSHDPGLHRRWLRKSTKITASVRLKNAVYAVSGALQSGRLRLFATDTKGIDVTAAYQYALTHCPEQDAIEAFDGGDKSIPLRLHQYYCQDDHEDLSDRTERLADTKTFHNYLYRYIQNFRPEPINGNKNCRVTLDEQGTFLSQPADLSATEEKLFSYLCFLYIAKFWADFEKIRDLHHEKKPLLIYNFLEFLDESTNISNLIARTRKLDRQIIILTDHMEESKKKWMGESNGLFF